MDPTEIILLAFRLKISNVPDHAPNTSIFVLYRTSRFLEKGPNSQGKPPEEKGQSTPPSHPLIHSLMAHSGSLKNSAQAFPFSGIHSVLFLSPLLSVPFSFLLTYIH